MVSNMIPNDIGFITDKDMSGRLLFSERLIEILDWEN